MVVNALVIGAIILFDGWAHGVLVLEAALIVLFGVFWVIQTVERWKALPPAQ